jgi:predicted NUDIX family phosphoesterase
MSSTEQVLVVERRVFDRVGAFQGISFDVERFLDAFFAPGTLRFMPRPAAEQDPSFKQIIPYVIMTDGRRYLTYVRGKRAGEQRLVGFRSIGIGGHINPQDDLPLFSDFREAYRTAVEREVAEEIGASPAHQDRIVALLNDDSTEVGRVHLGIVHYWSFPCLDFQKREQMITQLSFMTLPELRTARETLESWSQFCVDHLERFLTATTR